jgi:aspartate aminotransferase
MRERIDVNRRRFAEGLADAGLESRREAILRQRGMFSLLGLTDEQVARLREEFAIYVVSGGRVNVAGLTSRTIEPVCRAVAEVARR